MKIVFYVADQDVAALEASDVPREGDMVSLRVETWRVQRVTWVVDDADNLARTALRANVELEPRRDANRPRPVDHVAALRALVVDGQNALRVGLDDRGLALFQLQFIIERLAEIVARADAEAAHPPMLACQDGSETCHPFIASCGTKFCTFEEQRYHERKYHAACQPDGGSA